MTGLALVALGIAALCFATRLVVGPTLSDRVIGLDGLVIVGIAAVAVRAVITGNGSFLPVLVVVTLVGFVSTAASARFIEARADREDGYDVAPDGEAAS